MGFYLRKRSARAGLAPGTIAYGGLDRTHEPILEVFAYDESTLIERTLSSLEELDEIQGAVVWLNVIGVHNTQLIEAIGRRFQLHSLGLEDVASTLQRAKVDDYGDHAFIFARMLGDGTSTQAFSEQVALVLGRGYVISFQEVTGDAFDAVRRRIRESIGRIRSAGPDYLAYTLLDVIVDDYFARIERVSDLLEALEDEVQDDPPQDTIPRLRNLRARLVMTRRAAWPLREAVSRLVAGELNQLQPETTPYLRDLYDHVVQIIDIIESLREVSVSIHDLYMAAISNRMNEIMKFLTIMGTIFIPLTFVAGIYGMNFANMPELSWPYGYPVALGSMAAMGLALVFYFRRKGWL